MSDALIRVGTPSTTVKVGGQSITVQLGGAQGPRGLNGPEMTDFAGAGGADLIGVASGGTVQDAISYMVSASAFGFVGDDSDASAASNLAALQAAAAAAEALSPNFFSTGGAVILPPGVGRISNQFVLPNRVRLIGSNRRASVLKAASTFPASTAMVRLGSGAALAFDTRLENLTLHCNDITGSIGIFSDSANEGCGAQNVRVTAYKLYGIHFEDAADTAIFNDHFLLDEVDLGASEGIAAGLSTGFRLHYLRQGGKVRRLTVNPNGASGTTQAAGVHVTGTNAAGCHLDIDGINVERHADGVLFGTNAGGRVNHGTHYQAGTNAVRIAGSLPVACSNIYKITAANSIKNDTTGETITINKVPMYVYAGSGNGSQSFLLGGASITTGHVCAPDAPNFLIKSLATGSVGAGRCALSMMDGDSDGWRIRFDPTSGGDALQLIPYTAGTLGSVTVAFRDTGNMEINGTQVIGPRKTGWTADTGTAKRSANATYTAPTASATYSQAEMQAVMNALRDATQTIKSLKDDLFASTGHGLIGT